MATMMTKWQKIIIAKTGNLKLIGTESGFYGLESWALTFWGHLYVILNDINVKIGPKNNNIMHLPEILKHFTAF